jgi:hypothetical protein
MYWRVPVGAERIGLNMASCRSSGCLYYLQGQQKQKNNNLLLWHKLYNFTDTHIEMVVC